MPVDVLSDVLRAVRLTGAVYFDFELSSPWVLEAPRQEAIIGKVMPGAQRIIEYHLVARGNGWGHVAGHRPIQLSEGDLLLMPQGDAHTLSSDQGLRAPLDMSPFARPFTQLPVAYEIGGGGPQRARIVCCFLGCDERPYNPLLASLPAVIHLSGSGPDPAPGWLGALLPIAANESGRAQAGSENVLSRLSELMFVEAIRRYVETLPLEQTGWLSGLRDPAVGQALAAVHSETSRPWSVEELARLAGLSRSVFAERFAAMIGHPPMHYLALWRMQLAARLMADGGTVAATAATVGYESEAAFSRAFKKLVGHAPGTWRKHSAAQFDRAS
jgi:AraC-like DNA-binding protein